MKKNETDWSWIDIKHALEKKGLTFAQVERDAGLGASTLSNARYRPYPNAQRIIAKALGVKPQVIWPSRY